MHKSPWEKKIRASTLKMKYDFEAPSLSICRHAEWDEFLWIWKMVVNFQMNKKSRMRWENYCHDNFTDQVFLFSLYFLATQVPLRHHHFLEMIIILWYSMIITSLRRVEQLLTPTFHSIPSQKHTSYLKWMKNIVIKKFPLQMLFIHLLITCYSSLTHSCCQKNNSSLIKLHKIAQHFMHVVFWLG